MILHDFCKMRHFSLDATLCNTYKNSIILKKSCKMEVFKMLLEFRFENYKSFLEESSLSMIAAPKQKGLDYSLITVKNKGKDMHRATGTEHRYLHAS